MFVELGDKFKVFERIKGRKVTLSSERMSFNEVNYRAMRVKNSEKMYRLSFGPGLASG